MRSNCFKLNLHPTAYFDNNPFNNPIKPAPAISDAVSHQFSFMEAIWELLHRAKVLFSKRTSPDTILLNKETIGWRELTQQDFYLGE